MAGRGEEGREGEEREEGCAVDEGVGETGVGETGGDRGGRGWRYRRGTILREGKKGGRV